MLFYVAGLLLLHIYHVLYICCLTLFMHCIAYAYIYICKHTHTQLPQSRTFGHFVAYLVSCPVLSILCVWTISFGLSGLDVCVLHFEEHMQQGRAHALAARCTAILMTTSAAGCLPQNARSSFARDRVGINYLSNNHDWFDWFD